MAGDFSDLERRLQALKQRPAPPSPESRLAALKGPQPKPVSEGVLWDKLEKLRGGEKCSTDPRRGDYQFDERPPMSKEDQVNNLLSEVQDAVRLGIHDGDHAEDESDVSTDATTSSSSSSSDSSTHSSDSSQQRRRNKKKKAKARSGKKKTSSSRPPPSFVPDPVQQAAIRRLFGRAKSCEAKKEALMNDYTTHSKPSEGVFIATDADKNGIRRMFGLPEKVSAPLPSAPDISEAAIDAVLLEVMNDTTLD